MVDKTDPINRILNGDSVKDIINESKESAMESIVASSQDVIGQIKACAKNDDLEGIKVLLSASSANSEQDVEAEIDAKEEPKEAKEEPKSYITVELSKSLSQKIDEIDDKIKESISDKSVVRALGAHLEQLNERIQELKN